ncbi:carbamate kinase [Candidatus Micrarchaeota archaeon]|nr:carbamate kinase [Candidatus Micrarchaeota archaeon]MBU1166467.1 carbamate kinase [Candidatus Micrarchaeota archaeon]MBU1886173.1 carbamate kinase [Candidatus Micrarchaeota archaeon]
MRIVIALGGNALLPKGGKGTASEQLDAAKKAVGQIGHILKQNQVVLTHGNGPQVGNLLLQQSTNKEVPEMPLDVLDAMTQGQIGYFIASAISMTGFHSATLVTRVVVDENDPAFKNPTKPIGPFYDSLPKTTSQQNAKSKTGNSTLKTENPKQETSYIMDAGRGYRLVVPSPEPIKIREHDAISALLEKEFVVIAVGGGGIPIKSNGEGLEAVIDKDNATSLLASQINAELLVFVTSVDQVYLNFGKEDQKAIAKINMHEAEEYAAAGHFAEGSMKPKIASVIKFIKNGGKKAVICSINNIKDAIEGKGGTVITQ